MSVQSQIDRLNAIKQRIRTNLAAQGITVPADTTLDEMATMILSVAGNTSVAVITKTEYSALTADSVKKFYADGIRLIIVEDESVNLVPSAVSANGGIYNGCGYMNGIRLNSSGEIVTSRQSCVTGFIPFTYGLKLSVYGSKGPLGTPGQYVAAYDDSFALKGVIYMESLSGVTATADEDNIYTFTANTTQTMFNGASYIRISLNPCEGRDIIVQFGGDAE